MVPTSDCSDHLISHVDVRDGDPELREGILHVHATKLPDDDAYVITKLEQRLSCWRRMQRVIAVMLSFAKKSKPDPIHKHSIAVADLAEAQASIVRMVQKKYFPSSTGDKRIAKLDPFVCEKQGVLRVGGRSKRADYLDMVKFPVILPKESAISRRLVEYYHHKVGHGGRTSTLNLVRQNGFWVIGGNKIVRSVINKCTTSRSLRGKLGEQKESFSEVGPFTYLSLIHI